MTSWIAMIAAAAAAAVLAGWIFGEWIAMTARDLRLADQAEAERKRLSAVRSVERAGERTGAEPT